MTQLNNWRQNAMEIIGSAFALIALARNCDKYKTPEESIRMFESYIRESGKVGFINPFTEVVKWLFAPATKQKGETDGGK